MRELTIGDKKVGVRATPLALLYYRQEFGRPLEKDLLGLIGNMVAGIPGIGDRDIADQKKLPATLKGLKMSDIGALGLDTVGILQIAWAMAKADAGSLPSFEAWYQSLGDFSALDQTLLSAVLEEAADGFFRRANKPGPDNK